MGREIPGRPWSRWVADEEHLVVSLQRYVNTGLLDDFGVLEATFGAELSVAAGELILVLRPWLAMRAAA